MTKDVTFLYHYHMQLTKRRQARLTARHALLKQTRQKAQGVGSRGVGSQEGNSRDGNSREGAAAPSALNIAGLDPANTFYPGQYFDYMLYCN